MSDEKVGLILLEEFHRLPPGPAGDPFNFINEVLQFLTRWCSAYPASIELAEPAYCCFVGCERVAATAASNLDFTHRILFREDTPADLLSGFYLCSLPLATVYGRSVNFANLGECESALVALGLGDVPAVIFNAAERRVLWRLSDSASWHQAVIRTEPAPTLTPAEFDRALDDFHCEYTQAPDGLSLPWDNAKEQLTKPRLEGDIRNDLFIYFRNLMQDNFAVFRESFQSSGRADLLVYFRTEQKAFYMELKVLREYRLVKRKRRHVSEKFNIRWGSMGIGQAYSYKRLNRTIGVAYVCCFDARTSDVELKELVDLADRLDIEYRRYFMYTSAEELHKALIS